AIDEMGKVFAIDAVKHETAAALSASRSIDDMQKAVIFLSTSVSLVNQYAGSGDFAAVNKLTPRINFVSTQTRNREIIAGVRNRLAQIKDAQAEYDRLKAGVNRAQGMDPNGDIAAGKFACFFKNDWDYALGRF